MRIRPFSCTTVALLAFAFTSVPALAAGDDDSLETRREQALALGAELSPLPALAIPAAWEGTGGDGPLFIGVDDVAVPTYRIDVTTGIATLQFTGFQVWGAAYDATNDRILFNSGSTLYEWPIGGSVNALGTITDPVGTTLSMVSLAWYQDTLYATRNIANEGVYTIDTSTLVATLLIDYVDGDFDFGGLAIDQTTGTIYGTNDDATPNGAGLFQINMDASANLIAAYPAGQTDIDGLAVGGGFAYLVTDEPGDIFVWDFGGATYATPIPNPWTSAEIFSGAAWIEVVDTMPFLDGFESGDTSAWSSTVP